MGCIYRAYVPASGKFYIGQTKHETWEKRYPLLRSGYKIRPRKGHYISHWEKAQNLYGLAGIQFRNLMTNVGPLELDALERFFIRVYQSSERAHGYNTELGGNRHKTVSPETRRYRSLTSGIHGRWYHRKFGHRVDNPCHISKEFGLDQPSLNLVRQGRHRSHRGWVCLDAPAYVSEKGRPRVWAHDDGRVFTGDTRAITREFPDEKLYTPHLTRLVRRLPGYQQHKGWRYLRDPDKEEEEAFRLWWADRPDSDSDPRRH